MAAGVEAQKIALYEPPYLAGAGALSLQDTRTRVQALVSAGDRAGAVRFFMTEAFGAPRAFAFVMPVLMPNAWRNNKTVVHTTAYDLTILGDRTVLERRSNAITVPALVIGGEKSPQPLRDAVTAVAKALPNGQTRFLPGQDHNISAPVLAPVLVEYFRAN